MAAPALVPGQANIILAPASDGASTFASKYQPFVAAGADGRFIAIWDDFLPTSAAAAPPGYPASYGYDTDGSTTIMLRVFNADGTLAGLARPVTANLAGGNSGAGIITLGNGNVAIGWDATVTGVASRIGAVIVDGATGATVGTELELATGQPFATGVTFHQMVALSGGRAGVIYVDGNGGTRLKLAVIEADGSAGATSTLFTASVSSPPGIGIVDAATALGGTNADVVAIVTQVFSGPDRDDFEIVFRNLNGSAAAIPTLNLGPLADFAPTIVAMADGGFALSHVAATGDGTTIQRVQRYDAGGVAIGDAIDVTFPGGIFSTIAELLALPDGGLIIAMSAVLPGGTDSTIFGQRIAADGTLDGGVVALDSSPAGYQTRPALALTTDNDMVVVWEDSRQAFQNDVRAARFDLGDFPAPGQALAGTAAGDTLEGDTGPDRIVGLGGADSLAGLAGADTLLGGNGDDTLDGGAEGDLLRGGNGNDLVLGGAGNDRITGDAGEDSLVGGAGLDRLFGGAGADVFVWTAIEDSPVATPDRVIDFAAGDRIDLSAIDADGASPLDDGFAFIGTGRFSGGAGIGEVRYVNTATATVIFVDDGDADRAADMRIVLLGVHTLTEADFVL